VPLHVTCFGEFKVTRAGQSVGTPGWLATKAGDLFAYFITCRDRPVPRDRVLEALWPEVAPERSSGAFHSALYKMRQMLRGDSPGKFVRSSSGEYGLENERFAIDADEFTALYAQSANHPHESLEKCESCVERLGRAVGLYQGDYLENLYHDWAVNEQRHLLAIYLKALDALEKHYASRGEYETAVVYGRRMLDKDPLLEDVHRRMMQHYGRLRDRNGVMRQYRRLVEILADELGVEPMVETQELYRTLITSEIR
jgi:two-component SAPR family response regulator